MIEVSHLTKRYGANLAVDDLSFTIEKGVIYGLLGPNGAGKSTTMNIITGCLLSIGLFISSVTESQVAAAVITLLTMMLLYFMGSLASWVSADAAASLKALMALAVAAAIVFYIMSQNPIMAVVVGAALIGGLQVWYRMDSSAFSGLFGKMMSAIGVFDRFNSFIDGVFDVTAIVYYLSIIGVMLFLTTQAMEKRRWSE